MDQSSIHKFPTDTHGLYIGWIGVRNCCVGNITGHFKPTCSCFNNLSHVPAPHTSIHNCGKAIRYWGTFGLLTQTKLSEFTQL
ncbi:hypothetical protein E2C01_062926 [Portunus trituberculatus]|uniref:Uncharacterized protein n=1 Tax=Portunus trituberculatus TaxID=210409 RepID=A0A5B7H7V1_PORTR|nr:hypothetical protein [Portunus trituberculatus]